MIWKIGNYVELQRLKISINQYRILRYEWASTSAGACDRLWGLLSSAHCYWSLNHTFASWCSQMWPKRRLETHFIWEISVEMIWNNESGGKSVVLLSNEVTSKENTGDSNKSTSNRTVGGQHTTDHRGCCTSSSSPLCPGLCESLSQCARCAVDVPNDTLQFSSQHHYDMAGWYCWVIQCNSKFLHKPARNYRTWSFLNEKLTQNTPPLQNNPLQNHASVTGTCRSLLDSLTYDWLSERI